MNYLEQKIRRYEHKRWAAEPSRRSLPFAWGIDHLGGRADDPDPRAFLRRFVEETLAASGAWFACETPADYELRVLQPGEARWSGELEFTSAIRSPWPRNDRVHARLFSASARVPGPAVVVLPQWNADYAAHVEICRWLNRLGITALRLSLPYHDKRTVPGHTRADQIVGANVGLTLQANRQAVCDARCSLRWLEMRGYGPLGILGTSLGSCISCITASHEPLVRAAALLHVSSYFGDVVANGLTTIHVWETMRPNVSEEEIRHDWAPISPMPYISKLRGTGQKILAISGRYDPTFSGEFSEDFFAAIRSHEVDCEILRLPCGHYSLGEAPFKWIAGWRFGKFLERALK
ncbi:MAG TPA: alpha/beta hydrolase family protein [Candidatus Acidoferrales bacterium]|nr:alpha/beta hydrolase family protein [Candidatus Acidoferrales bacterium]